MTDSIFIGIDVSKQSNVFCILDQAGNRLAKGTISNNLQGAKEVVAKTVFIACENAVSNITFGIEATSVYGETLLYYLYQEQQLKAYNCMVCQLNPKQVYNFKKIYLDVPKTDSLDAAIIAECLRFGKIGTREVAMDERYNALKTLTRSRYFVVENLAREKNRYLKNLFLSFSSLTQEDDLFSNLFGSTALSFVKDFNSLDEVAYMSVEDLADYLNKKGKGKFADPELLARNIQKAARSSYRLPKTVEASVNQALAISITSIRAFQNQIKSYDKAIEELMKAIPNTLTSIKGIGPIYSAGIIAEIGDINRFKDQAALAKYAGLSWTRYQSGGFESSKTRLINSGNKYLKYYLIEATNSVRMHDLELKRYYNLKYQETPKTPHKRALVLTARKFVRLVYALLRSNRLYTPPRE
ncbi:MAG: IS110 family transposase [Peptostreptococcales bacterium]